MLRRVAYLAVIAVLGSLLAGCALNVFSFDRRASWREEEERVCMSHRPQSSYIRQVRAIDGSGVCGIDFPLKVVGLQSGAIGIGPNATMGCPMTEMVEIWMTYSVQPAALAYFGSPVVSIKQISSYACRSRNNVRGADLSEHAFGNALDVAGFKLADGREVIVRSDWYGGSSEERGFLREVYASATRSFKTVLGPGARYHGDHFHLDLAHHNKTGTAHYANPKASMVPPARRPFDASRYAALPGQPRYDATAYTGSIAIGPALDAAVASSSSAEMPPPMDDGEPLTDDDLVSLWGRPAG